MAVLRIGRYLAVFAIAALGVAVVVGCDDDSGGGGPCSAASAKLQSCKLIAPNTVFACEDPTSEHGKCQASCVLALSCNEFALSLCAGQLPESLDTCTSKCAAEPPLTCANGSKVDYGGKCDGTPDCSDGSDELGCPIFSCADGSKVPADYRCNGVSNCDDGSDELGCAPRAPALSEVLSCETYPFTCGSGIALKLSDVCDGLEDCPNGTDELNCDSSSTLYFTCADGGTVDADPRL